MFEWFKSLLWGSSEKRNEPVAALEAEVDEEGAGGDRGVDMTITIPPEVCEALPEDKDPVDLVELTLDRLVEKYEKDSKLLSISLPKETYTTIDQLSEVTDRSLSELFRTALGLLGIAYEAKASGRQLVVVDVEKGEYERVVKSIAIPLGESSEMSPERIEKALNSAEVENSI